MQKKVLFSIFIVIFVGFISLTNVFAASNEITIKGNATVYSTLTAALTAAVDNDTILIGDGTYDIGSITIDKIINIEGASNTLTKLTGNFNVKNDFTLKGVLLTTTSVGVVSIEITAKSTVKLMDVKLINTGEKDVVKISGGGNGTTLSIINSELNGKYGLKVRATDTNINVSGTKMSGYGAIDIAASVRSNGGAPFSNNKLTVDNSTLLGINNYATLLGNNEYAVITIAGQKNSIFDFNNCVITNDVSTVANTGNSEALIDLNNTYYMPNVSTKVTVRESSLINTDKTHDSYVLRVNNLDGNKNELFLSANTVITPEGKYVAPITVGEIKYFTVILKDFYNNEQLISVKEESKIEPITHQIIDGYTFDAWYLGNDKYDFLTPVTKNITLVSKYTKNVVLPVEPSVTNPNTNDNVAVYFIISVVGLLGLVLSTYFLTNKKQVN